MATLLEGYASDLRKGALTGRPLLDLYVEPDDA